MVTHIYQSARLLVRLDAIACQIADFYDDEVDNAVNNLTL